MVHCRLVTYLLPISLFNMLLLVQLRHYAISHTGFYTRQRAIKRIDEFVREYPLTEYEKELMKKPLTERVIMNMLTEPMF